MKPDQERVRNLLTDTVTLLCKNGLAYQDHLRIEGLLCVTIDADNFFVHISKLYGEDKESEETNQEKEDTVADDKSAKDQESDSRAAATPSPGAPSPASSGRTTPSSRKRRHSQEEGGSRANVKQEAELDEAEEEDDLIMIEPDSKEGILPGTQPRRIPELHGDMDAMQQGYMQHYSQGGEPSRKRNRDSQSNSPFPPASSMRNASGSWSDTSYNSPSALGGDGSNMSGDSMPGCSAWPTSAGDGGGGGTGPTDMMALYLTPARGGPRLPPHLRPFKCTYPGCNKSFTQKRNLRAHERYEHGRPLMKAATHGYRVGKTLPPYNYKPPLLTDSDSATAPSGGDIGTLLPPTLDPDTQRLADAIYSHIQQTRELETSQTSERETQKEDETDE